MTRFRKITKFTISLTLSVFMAVPLVVLADVSGTVKSLGDVVTFWEEQAAKKGNKPQGQNCEYMRAQLEKARAELAQENKALAEARRNPPKKDNPEGGLGQTTAEHQNKWQEKLDAAQAAIDNLAGRIDALCPPPPPKKEDDKTKSGKGKKDDGKDVDDKGDAGGGSDPKGGDEGGSGENGSGGKKPESPKDPDSTPSGEKPGKGNQQSPKVGTIPGVVTIALETKRGQVKLTLPADMRAGDTISGTVIAEPTGKNSAERARNQHELNGYVVELERAKTSVMGKSLKWAIPAALGGTGAYLILKDRKGKEVARRAVPVQANALATERLAVPAPGDYQLPTIGQAGRPLQISGPFDGDFGTTSLKVGGHDVKKLAEWPRGCLFESPTNIAGPTEITLKEENIEARGEYHNVGVRLSAPKTDLLKGEHTTLTVEVKGLEGIREEVPLRFENFSPAVVHMEGGDAQTINVRPEDVQPGGNFTMTRGLTGRQAGAFQISVTVLACAGSPVDMDDIDSVDELMDELKGKSQEEKRRILNATLEALNAAKAANDKDKDRDKDGKPDEAWKEQDDWLNEKIRIVEMAKKRVG